VTPRRVDHGRAVVVAEGEVIVIVLGHGALGADG
jgi:hypothetical protein